MPRARLLVAFVAIACALVVPTASAVAAEFRDTVSPDALTFTGAEGSGNQVFNLGAAIVYECKTLAGTTTATTFPTSQLVVTPEYGGCKGKTLGVTYNATVVVHGCQYKLNAGGSLNIVCSGTNEIELKAPFCTIKLGSQTLSSGLSYVGSGSSVEARLAVAGLSETNNCGASGTMVATGHGLLTSTAGGVVSVS